MKQLWTIDFCIVCVKTRCRKTCTPVGILSEHLWFCGQSDVDGHSGSERVCYVLCRIPSERLDGAFSVQGCQGTQRGQETPGMQLMIRKEYWTAGQSGPVRLVEPSCLEFLVDSF
jgi:hypothetical protein